MSTKEDKLEFLLKLGYEVVSDNLGDNLEVECITCKHTFKRPYHKFKSGTILCNNCELNKKIEYLKSLGFTPIGNKLVGKIKVQCNEGHIFEREYFSFKHYHNCPLCDKEITIGYLKSLGFTPISNKLVGKIKVQCNEGHIFEREMSNFRAGISSCPICDEKSNANYIETLGFSILSKKSGYVKVQCPKKHTFERLMSNFRAGAITCLQCEKEEKVEYLKSLGFTPISINIDNSLEVECTNNHSFKRAYRNFVLGAHACPVCEKEEKVEYLKSLGFTPISINLADDLVLQCNNGHSFPRLYSDIKRGVDSCPICYPYASSAELQIKDFILSLGITDIIHSDWVTIAPKELDIFLPDHNIAIEYNGIFWHTENSFGFNMGKKGQNYHYDKFIECNRKNINLLSFDSSDWGNNIEIVKSIIRQKLGKTETKYYARKLNVRNVSTSIAREFLNTNHIQGNVSASIKIGLYNEDTLISLMCFTNKQNEYELVRFASLLNTSVVGGASKLFKYFLREHSDKPIISFSDNRWFSGGLYEQLGFTKEHDVKPSYEYIHKNKQNIKFHKSNFMLSRIKQKYPEQFNENLTEYENMQILGYDRIWDCGKVKWKYNLI